MREISLDPEKARALKKMSENILERVEETDEEKFPSQIVFDIWMMDRQLAVGLREKDV